MLLARLNGMNDIRYDTRMAVFIKHRFFIRWTS